MKKKNCRFTLNTNVVVNVHLNKVTVDIGQIHEFDRFEKKNIILILSGTIFPDGKKHFLDI